MKLVDIEPILAEDLADFFNLKGLILFFSNELFYEMNTDNLEKNEFNSLLKTKTHGVAIYFEKENYTGDCWTTDTTEDGIKSCLSRGIKNAEKLYFLNRDNIPSSLLPDNTASAVHEEHIIPFSDSQASKSNIQENNFTNFCLDSINNYYNDLNTDKNSKIETSLFYRRIERLIINNLGKKYHSSENYFSCLSSINAFSFPFYSHIHSTNANVFNSLSSLINYNLLKHTQEDLIQNGHYKIILSNNATKTFLRSYLVPTLMRIDSKKRLDMENKLNSELNLIERNNVPNSVYSTNMDDLGCPTRTRGWINDGAIYSILNQDPDHQMDNSCTGGFFRGERIKTFKNQPLFPLYQNEPSFIHSDIEISLGNNNYSEPLSQSVNNGLVINYLSSPFKAKEKMCFVAFNGYQMNKGEVVSYHPQFYIFLDDILTTINGIEATSEIKNTAFSRNENEIQFNAFVQNKMNAYVPHIPLMN